MYLVIAVLLFVLGASAQGVEFSNSQHLRRYDNSSCSTAFMHHDYLFTNCVNGTSHDVQIWDCHSGYCVEYELFSSEDHLTPIEMYEHINEYQFRFFFEKVYIIECLVIVNDTVSSLDCQQIFDLSAEFSRFNTKPSGFSSHPLTQDIRITAYTEDATTRYSFLYHFDCIFFTLECELIGVDDVKSFYSGILNFYKAIPLSGGAVTLFTDPSYLNSRGAIIKLNCLSVAETYSYLPPRCNFTSISVIDNALPYTLLGRELQTKVVGSDISILAGAPGWNSPNNYSSGAIASFFCSYTLGPKNPCTAFQIGLYPGPSSNCYDNKCLYGDEGTISTDGSGYRFVVGVSRYNQFLGQIHLFSCIEMPLLACSRVGDFRPNYPPFSDGYGFSVSYNYDANRIAVISKAVLTELWTVETIFNDTSFASDNSVMLAQIKETPSHTGR